MRAVALIALLAAACAPRPSAPEPALANRGGERVEAAIPEVPYRGDPRAPNVLDYWFDYECPHCAVFAGVLASLEEQHGSKYVIYYRNFQMAHHPGARRAAVAAEAARRQGDFFRMHDTLIARQPQFDAASLRAYAQELGLDLARYDADVADPAAAARIEREYREAEEHGVSFVPRLDINGVLFEGDASSVDEIAAALR